MYMHVLVCVCVCVCVYVYIYIYLCTHKPNKTEGTALAEVSGASRCAARSQPRAGGSWGGSWRLRRASYSEVVYLFG